MPTIPDHESDRVKGRSRIRWILGVCLGLAVLGLLAFLFAGSERDFTQVPLSENQFIKDTIEPIKIVDSMVWLDGGSRSLIFEDSRQVRREVCLKSDLAFQYHNLSFDFVPSDGDSRRVPISGSEEKALIGLLQRWQRHDPEARQWHDRIERYHGLNKLRALAGLKRIPDLTGPFTQDQYNKLYTMTLIKILLERN
jgi:hypothetical protein